MLTVRDITLMPGVSHMRRFRDVEFAFSLEAPVVGSVWNGFGIPVSGWVVGCHEEITALRLRSSEGWMFECIPKIWRADVADAATQLEPPVEVTPLCGFAFTMLAPRGVTRFEWTLTAVTGDRGVERSLAVIRGWVTHSGHHASTATPPLLIAGFHRSGTSVLAELLASAGIHMGNEQVPPRLSNADGHFEDCWAVDIHNAILASAGRSWQSISVERPNVSAEQRFALEAYVHLRSGSGSQWGLKDPRAAAVLPTWAQVVPGIRVLVPVRDPAACASSLRQRQAAEIIYGPSDASSRDTAIWSQPDLPVAMWALHHEWLLECAGDCGSDLAFVSHEQLLRDPRAALRDVLGSREIDARIIRTELLHARTVSHALPGVSQQVVQRVNDVVARLGSRMSPTLRPIEAQLAPLSAASSERAGELLELLPFDGELEGIEPLGRDSPTAADAFTHAGRWEDALKAFGRSTGQHAAELDALIGSAECLLILGDVAGARRLVEHVVRAAPATPWPWQRCGRTVIRINDAELSAAFADAMQLRCDGSDANWVAVTALWLMRSGKVRLGAATLDAARDLSPTPLLIEARVECALRNGNLVLARRTACAYLLQSWSRSGFGHLLHHCARQIPDRAAQEDYWSRICKELEAMLQCLGGR